MNSVIYRSRLPCLSHLQDSLPSRSINHEFFSILLGPRGVGRLLLLLLDELALDADLDLVADDPLAIEHHIERHSVVFPADMALGPAADPVAHHGAIDFPILQPLYIPRLPLPLSLQSALYVTTYTL